MIGSLKQSLNCDRKNIIFSFMVYQLGSPEETPEQSEHLICSFLINSLQCSEYDLVKISFATVHWLPKHKSALQPTSSMSLQSPAIVVPLSKWKTKIWFYNWYQQQDNFRKNYKTSTTVYATTAQSASKENIWTFASGKKMRWKIEGAEYCLCANS